MIWLNIYDRMMEIWVGSELFLWKYLVLVSFLLRNCLEKCGYLILYIIWLIIILKVCLLSLIEFVIVCLVKICIIKYNNKFVLMKVFVWLLNKLLLGKRILVVKICINFLDIMYLWDINGWIFLSSGEFRWVNRLNSDLWCNCN